MSTRPRLRLRHLLLGAAAGALLWLQPGLVLDGQAPGSSAGSAAQADGQFCECEGCTSILVGKAASADGSTMTSHSCDSNTDRTWMDIVPAQSHKPGAMAVVWMDPKESKGPNDPDRVPAGEIPQAARTHKYLNAAYPIMNEHQLAIGETTFGGKRELRSEAGIIDCPELYRLVLERAKTAREAIRIADALTKEHGYNDWGEAFTFADKDEVWLFEILGPGRGKKGAVWAAVRIPDDEVSVSANAPRIRRIDLKDPDRYLASSNVYSLAEELGWWSPSSGEAFEFCTVYGTRSALGSRRREWRALSRIAPSLRLDPNSEHYPISVKPEKKLSVRDVLDIFRDAYEGTPFDVTRSLWKVDASGKATKSPVATPFMNNDYLELFNVTPERTIACKRATYLQITQSRKWLPDPIGGVVWLGYDNPVTTPHTPFYIGIEQMPERYMVDGRTKFRRDSAWWAFRQVSQLAFLRWQPMVKDIEAVWRPIEDKAWANQAAVEAEALALYQQDPAKARVFLTKYSHEVANGAVDAYWKLAEDLWSKYTNLF
ncbi:MAG TPA: C69 family dipeptidase [Vicinamibacterales bacterium]|nr:C69 family dipeptidase [Vicinamibacterales bacterium]HPW21752.1 C69 family dipeptidase [Vicinamibacterales bacterium]